MLNSDSFLEGLRAPRPPRDYQRRYVPAASVRGTRHPRCVLACHEGGSQASSSWRSASILSAEATHALRPRESDSWFPRQKLSGRRGRGVDYIVLQQALENSHQAQISPIGNSCSTAADSLSGLSMPTIRLEDCAQCVQRPTPPTPSHGWDHRFNPCRTHHRRPQKIANPAVFANGHDRNAALNASSSPTSAGGRARIETTSPSQAAFGSENHRKWSGRYASSGVLGYEDGKPRFESKTRGLRWTDKRTAHCEATFGRAPCQS